MAGLDGADGFSSPLWAEVERLLRNVPANQRAVFRAELNAAAPYQRDRRACSDLGTGSIPTSRSRQSTSAS